MARINKKIRLACLAAALLAALAAPAAFAEASDTAPKTGEEMVLLQLPFNAMEKNEWTFTQSGTGAVSSVAFDDYEAWRQEAAQKAKTEPGTVAIAGDLVPGCQPMAFKGEKEGLAALEFTLADPGKKNAKPEGVQTVKIKVYADKTARVLSSEAVWGKDVAAKKAAFTANEFTYLKDFSVAQDKVLKKAFLCPDYEDIVKGLGKPLSDSGIAALSRKLTYDFGLVTLDYEAEGGGVSALWFDIRNDSLPGPRNITVGDSYEEVLKSFKNNRKSTPKTSSKDLDLYRSKQQLGMITYANETGGTLAPQNIYYWNGNNFKMACSVQFFVEDGFVSNILWRIDPRA